MTPLSALSLALMALVLVYLGVRALVSERRLGAQVAGALALVWGAALLIEVAQATWTWATTFSLCVRC